MPKNENWTLIESLCRDIDVDEKEISKYFDVSEGIVQKIREGDRYVNQSVIDELLADLLEEWVKFYSTVFMARSDLAAITKVNIIQDLFTDALYRPTENE